MPLISVLRGSLLENRNQMILMWEVAVLIERLSLKNRDEVQELKDNVFFAKSVE